METTITTKKENGQSLSKISAETFEKLILKGDLSSLTTKEKINYYNGFCQRLGLDPLTQPFKILNLNGKEVLYCDRSGTQQLSNLHKVSHEIKSREIVNGCYVVTTKASINERFTESIGAVSIEKENGEWKTSPSGKKYFQGNGTFLPMKSDELCNAMMKAETKSKRRATLDLVGLGILDELEIETIDNEAIINIDEKPKGDISVEDLQALFELKAESLTEKERARAKEIIEKKEVTSYKKLHQILSGK